MVRTNASPALGAPGHEAAIYETPKKMPGTKDPRKASGALRQPSPAPGDELYFPADGEGVRGGRE